MYPSQWYAPPERAPHWQTFWEVWNRAVRLIRTIHPKAVVVGPSAAPGPGIPEGDPTGWLPQKQWLQAFLIQAHANGTLPDVLSWHDYTGDPAMATSMQSELRAWMTEQHMPMLPMGYNEIVDSVHAQSAGYHVATSVALSDTQADHAALGCWAEPSAAVNAPSTCWDGSLDGLLDPDSNFSATRFCRGRHAASRVSVHACSERGRRLFVVVCVSWVLDCGAWALGRCQ
jgi:hypothetical protein